MDCPNDVPPGILRPDTDDERCFGSAPPWIEQNSRFRDRDIRREIDAIISCTIYLGDYDIKSSPYSADLSWKESKTFEQPELPPDQSEDELEEAFRQAVAGADEAWRRGDLSSEKIAAEISNFRENHPY